MKTHTLSRTLLPAILAFSAGMLAVSLTHAVDKNAEIESRFKAADKDGDGKLTKDEAKAGMPRIYKAFDKIDKDKKGYLTLDQIKAAAER